MPSTFAASLLPVTVPKTSSCAAVSIGPWSIVDLYLVRQIFLKGVHTCYHHEEKAIGGAQASRTVGWRGPVLLQSESILSSFGVRHLGKCNVFTQKARRTLRTIARVVAFQVHETLLSSLYNWTLWLMLLPVNSSILTHHHLFCSVLSAPLWSKTNALRLVSRHEYDSFSQCDSIYMPNGYTAGSYQKNSHAGLVLSYSTRCVFYMRLHLVSTCTILPVGAVSQVSL